MSIIPSVHVFPEDIGEPTSSDVWTEIRKIIHRLKWCEDQLKGGGRFSYDVAVLKHDIADLKVKKKPLTKKRVKKTKERKRS
jgi:hypothetical protein